MRRLFRGGVYLRAASISGNTVWGRTYLGSTACSKGIKLNVCACAIDNCSKAHTFYHSTFFFWGQPCNPVAVYMHGIYFVHVYIVLYIRTKGLALQCFSLTKDRRSSLTYCSFSLTPDHPNLHLDQHVHVCFGRHVSHPRSHTNHVTSRALACDLLFCDHCIEVTRPLHHSRGHQSVHSRAFSAVHTQN